MRQLILRTGLSPLRVRFSSKRLDAFKSMGVTLVETKLPDYPYGMITGTVIGAEGASVFEELIESKRVDELADKKQIAGLKAAAETAALDYLKAMRIRRLIQQDFRQLWTDLDVLIAPGGTRGRDENHTSVGCAWPNSCVESWSGAAVPGTGGKSSRFAGSVTALRIRGRTPRRSPVGQPAVQRKSHSFAGHGIPKDDRLPSSASENVIHEYDV